MKIEKKIMLMAITTAILFWPVDVILDMGFHYDEGFIHVLFKEKEVYFRILSSSFIILFGYIASRLSGKLSISESKLKSSEGRYRSLVESTEDSIYLVDGQYRYIFINEEHRSRMELDGGEYIGVGYDRYHSEEETEIFKNAVDEVFRSGISIKREHKSMRDGKCFLRTFSPVRNDEGVVAVTVISKDITELKNMEDAFHSLAVTDDLTGVYNRRGFFTIIEQQIKMSIRNKKGLFLVYVDVDGLKEINDNFGHSEGDRALRDVAEILKETYRNSDILARIGGDEFVVIPVETDEEKVDMVTRRLSEELADFNSSGSRKYELSISFGVSYFDPLSPSSVDELLFEADKMMYICKKGKRK